MMPPIDRTCLAVRRQLEAMGVPAYDIAIGRDDGSRTWRIVLEAVTVDEVLAELAKLKRHNARGWGVHVRPCEPHGLVFLDDVELAVWERMIEQGYQPAAIVETSPACYQLWMRYSAALEPSDRGYLARWFARRARCDESGAGASHWGRLAGFTNRKPEYRGRDGRFPFVLLERAAGKVYDEAKRVVAEVLPRLRDSANRSPARVLTRADLVPIEVYWEAERFEGDLHRAELGWARHARNCGLGEDEIRETIRRHGRDLSKKGATHRQDQYAERTARKVFET